MRIITNRTLLKPNEPNHAINRKSSENTTWQIHTKFPMFLLHPTQPVPERKQRSPRQAAGPQKACPCCDHRPVAPKRDWTSYTTWWGYGGLKVNFTNKQFKYVYLYIYIYLYVYSIYIYIFIYLYGPQNNPKLDYSSIETYGVGDPPF